MFTLTLTLPLRHFGLIAAICMMPFAATAEEFRIVMLNTAADDERHKNVFAPDILHIEPGDIVTFVPTDMGHNTASKPSMIPEAADPWNTSDGRRVQCQTDSTLGLRLRKLVELRNGNGWIDCGWRFLGQR